MSSNPPSQPQSQPSILQKAFASHDDHTKQPERRPSSITKPVQSRIVDTGRHFLVAIDFSECSNYAVEWTLKSINFTEKDTLTLITVIEPPSQSERPSIRSAFDTVDEEQRAMNNLKKLWEFLDNKSGNIQHQLNFKLNLRVEFDRPMEKLVELSRTEPITTIIMGSHGKTGKRELGSVSNYCLKNSRVPVLVVRDPESSTTVKE